jgi:hypothetical protein
MSSVISMGVPIELAEHNLKELLQRLNLGETVTLVGAEGMPLAIMVSLRPAPVEAKPTLDWEARWDALARQISLAWKSDKGAVETLIGMRR